MMLNLHRHHKSVLLGCTIFLSALMLIIVQPAHSIPMLPAIWTVNTLDDPGAPTCAVTCSLRTAVNVAAAGDSIVFDAAVFSVPLTITLSEQIEIAKSLTIDGVARGGITPTLSSNHLTRTFQVDAGAAVMLKALKITAGKALNGGGLYNSGWLTITDSTLSGNTTTAGSGPYSNDGAGGGIFNSGTLFLTNSIIQQNQTGKGSDSWPAGPGGSGGGIFNSGTLTLTNSLVSENSTGDGGRSGGGMDGSGGPGGGIYNTGNLYIINSTLKKNHTGKGSGSTYTVSTIGGSGGAGGGTLNAGSLFISNSTVSENWAGNGGDSYTCTYYCNRSGGGGGGGGGIYNSALLSMTNTTVSGNRAGDGGRDGDAGAPPGNTGGQGGDGGGVMNYGSLSMINSTVVSNTAGNGGIGYTGGDGGDGGGLFSTRALSITHSTLSGNTAGNGAAGSVNGSRGSGGGIYQLGSILLKSTLINNNAPDANCSISSPEADGGYNLDSGNTCGFTTTNHSLMNTDPILGLLGDYGGQVQTLPLLSSSPARNVIPFGENGCGTTITVDARGVSRPQGIGCDIGAFEAYDGYGLALTPGAVSRSALPGSTVTYTLEMTNTGTTSDAFKITLTHGAFAASAPATIGPLAVSIHTTFTVQVIVPVTATGGMSNVTQVTVTSLSDGVTSVNSDLTTTVLFQIYLPLILAQP